MADSIIVGQFVGSSALAAVGACAALTNVFICVALGAGVGAGVLVSRYFGAREYGKMKTIVSTSLISFLVLSILLGVFGFGFTSIGESKIPLGLLIFSSILNIGMDLWMVAGLGLGVFGAALATLIAQGISAVLSLLIFFYRMQRYKSTFAWFDGRELRSMLQIAVPSVLQQSIDMMIVQAVVNPFGTQALAGYAATMRVELAVRQAGLQTSWFPMRHSENSGRLRRWSYLDKFGCQHGLFSGGQVYLLFLTVYLQEGCKREEMEDAMQIFHYGNLSASTVLIQPVDDHDLEEMETELNEIRKQGKADFQLIAVKVDNWNQDLSPWEASAVFGREGFGDGAGELLQFLLGQCVDRRKTYYIGGYSLAGLFSLWAAYQTDIFAGVAAVSPSVWFPGFLQYMKEYDMRAKSVYLSLGNREERTRNPLMATVGDCIREGYNLLKMQKIRTVLEWNPGNHFKDAGIRTAKGFAWLIRNQGAE